MQQSNPGKLEELRASLIEYVNLRIDLWKLSLVEGLAVVLSRGLTLVVLVICITFAALLTTCLAVVLLSEVMALEWALLIVAGCYAMASAIVYIRRKHLFTGSTVRMLSKLFFTPDDNETQEDQPQ